MELAPIMALLSTGVPWLDTTLRVLVGAYILYSLFLNALISAAPEYKTQTWVRVSLALFANFHAIFVPKHLPVPVLTPEPSPEPEAPKAKLRLVPETLPETREIPTLRPEDPTLPDCPRPTDPPPAAA